MSESENHIEMCLRIASECRAMAALVRKRHTRNQYLRMAEIWTELSEQLWTDPEPEPAPYKH